MRSGTTPIRRDRRATPPPRAVRTCAPAVAALGLLVVAGCGGGGDPEDARAQLERSCKGNTVPNCLPYEYSIVQEASLEPEGLEIGNGGQRARVRIVLATCGSDAPEPHRVSLEAVAEAESGLGDGGAAPAVHDLLTLRDDGRSHGDAAAKDGEIDVMVENPFVGVNVPPERTVSLRFVPRAPAQCEDECIGGTCSGAALEVPYETGPRFMPDG